MSPKSYGRSPAVDAIKDARWLDRWARVDLAAYARAAAGWIRRRLAQRSER